MQTLTGKIVKFYPRQHGESQRGPWVKVIFVVEYGEEYPKKVAFSLFGEERLQMCRGLKEGSLVQVSYNPESREYQDRWYTDLQCIRLTPVGTAQTQAPTQAPTPAPAPAPAPQPTYQATPTTDDGDDLPF